MTTTLDMALRYAARGWAVFPLQPAPIKRPITEHGFLDATTDHATITEWWQRWPSAQIGVACGASSLVFLDIDVKDGKPGLQSLDELEMEHGAHGSGLVMRTPSGGLQVAFLDRNEECIRRLSVRPGVDILGDGGYSILPSAASPGREWIEGDPFDSDDLVRVPRWIVGLAKRAVEPAAERAPVPAGGIRRELIPAEVADIEAALRCIPADERAVWIRMGMALKSTHAGEQAYGIWERWSKTSSKFDPVVARQQWDSLRPDRGSRTIGITTLFYEAQKCGYTGPAGAGWSWPAITLKVKGVQVGNDSDPDPSGTHGEASRAAESVAKPDEEDQFAMDWEDLILLDGVDWQIEDYLPRASIAMLVGDSEAGKSFLAIDLAMRTVFGMPFLGRKVEPGSVVYLAGEGQKGMASRFRAWVSEHAKHGDNEDRYCMVTREIPILSVHTMHKLDELIGVIAEAKGHAPSMIIIDTLSQGLDDDENDAKVIAPIIRGLMAIRNKWGCTIVIVHHLTKLSPKVRPTRDNVRGSSALTRNTDTVLALVSEGDEGLRTLEVWKQKDGPKPRPEAVFMNPVMTGWTTKDQRTEWSCIMIPGATTISSAGSPADAPVEPQESPEEASPIEKAKARIIAAAEELGAVEGELCRGAASTTLLRKTAGVRHSDASAAIEDLGRDGILVNAGTKSSTRWLLRKS